MKKTLIYILIAILLASGVTKSAHALIIDTPQAQSVVSRYVNMLKEMALKRVQQTIQTKLMSIQGFDTRFAQSIAKKYYKKGSSLLTSKTNNLVEGTKKKKIAENQQNADNYREAAATLYSEKLKYIMSDKAEIEGDLTSEKAQKAQKEAECARLEQEYQTSAAEGFAKSELLTAAAECRSLVTELENTIKEREQQLTVYDEVIKENEQKLEEASAGDAIDQANQNRIDLLSQDEEEKNTKTTPEDGNILKDAEWDTDKALDVYQIDEEEYQAFMKNYFYDPSVLASSSKSSSADIQSSRAQYENSINRINRNRRYLFINTAVHLMQVATTIRRELPLRSQAADDIFQGLSSDSELDALVSYSNTRIENAKALLLYAKLLSAKIQYLAARELLNTDIKKELVDENGKEKSYSAFDLNKYILTEEYIKKMIKEANETFNTNINVKRDLKFDFRPKE